jgi:hypothetical protein
VGERLRYTGEQATVFQEPGVGHVEPGGEFTVDASRLLSFMRRADIGHAGECPAPPCRCGQDPAPGPQAPGAGEAAPASGRRGRRKDAGDQEGAGAEE